jgi:hypothetical protein
MSYASPGELGSSRWPVVTVLISLPRAAVAVRDLRTAGSDISDVRRKALSNPYPLNSIRLHALFGEMMVLGLVAAGIVRWARSI